MIKIGSIYKNKKCCLQITYQSCYIASHRYTDLSLAIVREAQKLLPQYDFIPDTLSSLHSATLSLEISYFKWHEKFCYIHTISCCVHAFPT